MQEGLRQQLRQREHLANLGLAVAKINHDLRNMLASAQLMADRLATTSDPNVQRFVPKMLETLDRAIAFCQATLAYGKAQEQTPKLAPVALLMLVNDVGEQLALSPESVPALQVDITPGLRVSADPDHLHRVLTNLLRNARSALENLPEGAPRIIRISAEIKNGQILLDIRDSGPGIPPRIRETLFQAFSGGGQRGSTGLGLTIALELLRGMGGDMTLMETAAGKARISGFRCPKRKRGRRTAIAMAAGPDRPAARLRKGMDFGRLSTLPRHRSKCAAGKARNTLALLNRCRYQAASRGASASPARP